MKIVTKLKPVYYIIHNNVEIEVGKAIQDLNYTVYDDKTIFTINDPSDMALLDLIHKENEAIKAEQPDKEGIRHEYRTETEITIQWQDNEELIERITSRIYDLWEQAESEEKK